MASSSRWGSFLQQAVAGVESRLDTILGETEELPLGQASGAITPTAPVTKPKPEIFLPRKVAPITAGNDRLQERLARAMAAKNASSSSAIPSGTGSPATVANSARQSFEISTDVADPTSNTTEDTRESEVHENGPTAQTADSVSSTTPTAFIQSPTAPPTADPLTSKHSLDAPHEIDSTSKQVSTAIAAPSNTHEAGILGADAKETVDASSIQITAERNSIDSDLEHPRTSTDLRKPDHNSQDEMNEYIERIDALQAKLQYLSRESAETARKVASEAPANSLEKRVAEQDEQIALLMEEGQKLSKSELKHMTIIKRLRAHIAEADKEGLETRKKLERLEKDKVAFAERLKRMDVVERESNERQRMTSQLQRDVRAMTAERDGKLALASELKLQLSKATAQLRVEEMKGLEGLLESERRKVADLENDLSSAKIEKELAMGRATVQIEELRAKAERDAERARVTEMEMKAEQQMLESRLEMFRTRAEEVSSSATGDAQAKLLRQIEMLQSQYAIAGENWQRIEASLTSRITKQETEKNEALKREADTRRKAREVNIKSKRGEDELEELRTRMSTFQQEITDYKTQLDRARRRAEEAEASTVEARKIFEQEKQALTIELQQRGDEDRSKLRDEGLGISTFNYSHSRGADSPVTSMHRGLTAEYLGLQNLQLRRDSARSPNLDGSGTGRLLSRRSSAQPIRPGSGRITPGTPPVRQDFFQSFVTNGDIHDTPSIHTMDHDDEFENVVGPISPQDKTHDIMSISTVGAGPSVQLVERMSAAVRRLETEKVAGKEELSRLEAQRNEARTQIVKLMQELEKHTASDQQVLELEEENKKINARYQTTLEMLGEKSELVEELQADVQDVKAMYRELVERTVK